MQARSISARTHTHARARAPNPSTSLMDDISDTPLRQSVGRAAAHSGVASVDDDGDGDGPGTLPLLTDSEIAGIREHPNREAARQRLSQSIALSDAGALLFCDIIEGIVARIPNREAAHAIRDEIPPYKGAQSLATAWLFDHRARMASPNTPPPANPESQRAARLNRECARARAAFDSEEPMSAVDIMRHSMDNV
jgi:hypothetical protein